MFDQIKIKNNHQKAKANIAKAKFFQFINDDIIDRLEPVEKKFHKVLIINHNPEFIANIIKEKLPTREITYCLDYQNLDYQTNYFDLIIFPFGFHWIEDIQKFLINVVNILHKEGIFFANFPGGGSLQHLRRILIDLEAEAKRPHYAHISPFIQFNDITPLLQQAGFLEQIVDMEKLELEYDSPLKLMQAIKVVGYQWYWGYEYPDHENIAFDSNIIPDNELKPGQLRLLEVDNRIVIPENTTVKFLITAGDVIHSFAIPALGIKTDAVPGKINETWTKVSKRGVYYGQCSEICGVNHGFMPIALEVVSKEEFAAWVEQAKEKFASNNSYYNLSKIKLAENNNK